jgi:hypothetical protein
MNDFAQVYSGRERDTIMATKAKVFKIKPSSTP